MSKLFNNFTFQDACSNPETNSGFCNFVCPFKKKFNYLSVIKEDGSLVKNYLITDKDKIIYNVINEKLKYLQIDIIYMLRFAELLENEDIINGVIIVPVGSIFKYYKYMIKFIRTYVIKKFFNGTMANNKIFIDAYRKLIRYVENNLNKETNSINQSLPVNIICKNIL
jgi:hypothetical protein